MKESNRNGGRLPSAVSKPKLSQSTERFQINLNS